MHCSRLGLGVKCGRVSRSKLLPCSGDLSRDMFVEGGEFVSQRSCVVFSDFSPDDSEFHGGPLDFLKSRRSGY